MIKLTKLPEPDILLKNKTAWTAELLASQKPTDVQKNRYNQKEIKDRLKKETHEKCAYCESNFLATSHGDIEHIFPKSLDLSKSFEWDNLTFSCQICNQNKSNKPVTNLTFVDPYKQNPEDHFFFADEILYEKPNDLGAKTMILNLQLNRAELLKDRKKHLRELYIRLSNIDKTIDLASKTAWLDELMTYLQDPSEYAMMKRAAYFARTGTVFTA
jgi:uncharacterized protein (TIGR02646 family)